MDDGQFFRYLGWQTTLLFEREGFLPVEWSAAGHSEDAFPLVPTRATIELSDPFEPQREDIGLDR